MLRKCTARYKLTKSREKINHQMYMDDVKRFEKNEKELKTLSYAEKDVGMEFAGSVTKSGKRRMTDGMELPNQNKIRTLLERKTTNIWEY